MIKYLIGVVLGLLIGATIIIVHIKKEERQLRDWKKRVREEIDNER